MRRLLLAVVFVFSLGCMGAINGLTGLDIDMQFGADAVHPADFVVTPPAGEPMFSMGMTADADSVNLPEGIEVDMSSFDKVRMDMITYQVDDMGGVRKTAAEQLSAAGWTAAPSDEPYLDVFAKDGTMFIVSEADDGGEQTVTLIRLEPRGDQQASGEGTPAAE